MKRVSIQYVLTAGFHINSSYSISLINGSLLLLRRAVKHGENRGHIDSQPLHSCYHQSGLREKSELLREPRGSQTAKRTKRAKFQFQYEFQ